MMTPENSMKPEFIHPSKNIYDFSKADLLVGIALENGMTVHGHALIYDKSTPDWMTGSLIEQRQEIMVSHIENVVSHFKGKVAEWDVINELLSNKNAPYKDDGSGLKPNIWFEALEEKYIDLAFATAHNADPSAKLYLNDYGLENDGQRWDALLNLVKRLKERNVPIDGVGFQAHVYGDGDYINKDQLKKHMEILAKLGLLVRISEIDVIDENPEEQINQYATVLDVCLKAPNCTSYTIWGITDLYGSTTKSDRYPLVYGNSLLWDKDMKAKPAIYALQEKLKQ
jgi:endo-1,4-beta-xylanase